MIKKLQETSEKIAEARTVAADNETIEHLKMLVAPDAATLISQGDSLVLETHGNATPELAKTVMYIQAVLREKFREVQQSKWVFVADFFSMPVSCKVEWNGE